ncbi:MAG: GGDEF domain-containing protein [Spirochaetales bacterium]|nr:GGDEF domain-containing protein [Spirochaetales bacterium]
MFSFQRSRISDLKLKFADLESEKAYRNYTFSRRIDGLRRGALLILGSWAVFIIFYAFYDRETFPIMFLSTTLFFVTSTTVVYFLARRPTPKLEVHIAASISNGLTGIMIVYVAGYVLEDPTFMTLTAMMLMFFGHFVYNTFHPYAVAGTIPYAAFVIFALWNAPMQDGFNMPGVLVVFSVGWLVATIGGRMMEVREREAFLMHQETDRLNKSLRIKTYTDSLTKLYNREFFFETLSQELSYSQRFGENLVLAMLDIDHFKRVNDDYGHPTGDSVLREFGTILKDSFRDSDVLARYGGEEFIILMHRVVLKDAIEKLNSLRTTIENHEFPGVPRPVTCSIGAVLWHRGEKPDGLVARADSKLYKAKKMGRNRVEH